MQSHQPLREKNQERGTNKGKPRPPEAQRPRVRGAGEQGRGQRILNFLQPGRGETQLPGDRVGPEKAEPTGDHGWSRKRFSPPPKRSSAPSPGPRLAIAIQAAPPSRGEAGRVSTQSGGTREQRPRTSGLPKASRPFPAAPAGRRPPLGSPPRAPHAPCAQDRGQGGNPRREGGPGPAAGSRAALATARGLKLATARPSRPRLGDAPGEGGAAGPGWSAAPASSR